MICCKAHVVFSILCKCKIGSAGTNSDDNDVIRFKTVVRSFRHVILNGRDVNSFKFSLAFSFSSFLIESMVADESPF